MFRFLKKKEKPVLVYNIFEVGPKAIYCKDFTFVPTEVAYYKDRIDFCINRFPHTDEEDDDIQMDQLKVSTTRTDDRLIPLDVEGVTLHWDTEDLTFRRKVMPEGEPTPLIPQVLIYPNEVLTMEKEFAEKDVSPLALSYATLKDDVYIWYYPDGSITPTIFEIPRLFSIFNYCGRHHLSAHFIEILNHLSVYAPSYIEKIGLNSSNAIVIYKENLKHGASKEKE